MENKFRFFFLETSVKRIEITILPQAIFFHK